MSKVNIPIDLSDKNLYTYIQRSDVPLSDLETTNSLAQTPKISTNTNIILIKKKQNNMIHTFLIILVILLLIYFLLYRFMCKCKK